MGRLEVRLPISIHSLYAEGDDFHTASTQDVTEFQSTPSTQRETHVLCAISYLTSYFNPLPLRRGRHVCSLRSCALSSYFNPLPLRRGRHLKCHIIVFLLQFQSTPSTQRETALNSLSCSILLVFQSTPSTQRETISANLIALSGRFQSTPSTQRETLFLPSCRTHKIFQSTPSTQRETISHLADISPEFISIHSLYAEGDFLRPTFSESQTNFNPLPLRRGRRGILPVSVGKRDFNPLPLRRGRPLAMCFSLLNMGYFNPLPLRRGRLKIPCLSNSPLSFQSTPSA